MIVLSAFLVYLTISEIYAQVPIVETLNGYVEGVEKQTSRGNNSYYSFQAIPYGLPPLGELRFKPPLPAKNWTGILNGTQEKGDGCVQGLYPVTGSEDCLYINVYTPINPSNGSTAEGPLSVMVFIYGGAFIAGTSGNTFFDPNFFMDYDVIIVTFNYRLGAFGFLSTEDEACPGNWGLKDQILALHWVHDNIGFFGGDNGKVTAFGQSAGSASVSYLTQTHLTEGLFNQAIFESGVTFVLWGLSRHSKQMAGEIARLLDIHTSNTTVLVEELRHIDYKTLQIVSEVVEAENTLVNNILNGIGFGPVVEVDHPGAVVLGKSHERLTRGDYRKLPAIIGLNSNEGLYFYNYLNLLVPLELFDAITPSNLVPVDMNINKLSQSWKKNYVGGLIEKFYFPNELLLTSNKTSLTEYVSDDQFVRPIVNYTSLYSTGARTYFYRFSYTGNESTSNWPGVAHEGELQYLWKDVYGLSGTGNTLSDRKTSERMLTLWTNFAKFSDPTPTNFSNSEIPKWPVANVTGFQNLTYLNMDINFTIKVGLESKVMDFWNDLYGTYGVPPYDTY